MSDCVLFVDMMSNRHRAAQRQGMSSMLVYISFVLECVELVVGVVQLPLHLLCLQQVVLVYSPADVLQTRILGFVSSYDGLPVGLLLLGEQLVLFSFKLFLELLLPPLSLLL